MYTHTRQERICEKIRQELSPQTKSRWCRYVYKGPGGCLRWPPTPPGPRWPPALLLLLLLLLLERERTEGRKREKFYIYSDVTHTHTRPEPGQPWKARGRKKRTQTTGKRPKQRRGGGEQTDPKTNLHGETDLTKTERTPKPHDTLRRGTRGELGTSWWQTRETKTISLKTELSP